MTRIRRALAAIAAAPGRAGAALVDVVRRVVEPLRPEPDTTEASVYFGLVLIAAAFLVGGHPDWALGVPGVVITALGSAPVIVALRRRA